MKKQISEDLNFNNSITSMTNTSLLKYIQETKTIDLLPNLFIEQDKNFLSNDKFKNTISLNFLFEERSFSEHLGYLNFSLNHDVNNKQIIWKEFYPLNGYPDLIRLDPKLLSDNHYENKHLGTVAHMMALDYLKENVKDISSYVIRHDLAMDILDDRKKHLKAMKIDFNKSYSFDEYYALSLDFAIKKIGYDIFKK